MDVFEFITPIQVDEDPEDRQPEGLLNYYNVSPYIINNLGAFLSNLSGIYFVCLVLLGLKQSFLAKKFVTMGAVLYAFHRIFIWNFIISYYLSCYLSTVLYSVVVLRWFSFKSKWGTVNFCLGLIIGAISISLPFIIMNKIKDFSSLPENGSKQIDDNDNEKKKQKNEEKRGNVPKKSSIFFKNDRNGELALSAKSNS